MPRHLLQALVLGLIMAASLATASYAAGDPPPPIDWVDFLDGLGEMPTDSAVGEEMC